MIGYIEYLLADYGLSRPDMKITRGFMVPDDNAPQLLINIILDTELSGYVVKLVDYKLEKYKDVNTALDIIQLDKALIPFFEFMGSQVLKEISKTHKNPIWRVAAYVCDFLIRADEDYHGNR